MVILVIHSRMDSKIKMKGAKLFENTIGSIKNLVKWRKWG